MHGGSATSANAARQERPAPADLGAHGLLMLGLLSAGIGLAETPAQAQDGAILIMRDVPTRHATLSGTGTAVAVHPAPIRPLFGPGVSLRLLTDGESANVAAGPAPPGKSDIWRGPNRHPSQQSATAVRGGPLGTGLGLGSRIGGAVESGVGAATGAIDGILGGGG